MRVDRVLVCRFSEWSRSGPCIGLGISLSIWRRIERFVGKSGLAAISASLREICVWR